MNSARSIAAVGSSMRRLLQQRLADPVPVTIASPASPPGDVPGRRLNLFLYQVKHNPHLRNQEPDANDPRGTPARSPLALDLSFLITAYGNSDEDQLDVHELLGDAMTVLHDHAILDPREDGVRGLLDPELHQSPPLRIVPDALGLDDSSSVWHALSTPYRLSVTYCVSVVLIRSRGPVRHVQRVGEGAGGARIHLAVGVPPRLERLRVRRASDPEGLLRNTHHVQPGDTLHIHGQDLPPAPTVQVDGLPVETLESTDPEQIQIRLDPAAGLAPGPHTVHIVSSLGDRAVSSNRLTFLLVPRVDTIRVEDGLLTVEGRLLHCEGMERTVLLGGVQLQRDAILEAAPHQLLVRIPSDLEPGSRWLRVQVGGYETLHPMEVVL